MRKKAYRATDVKKVNFSKLIGELAPGPLSVGTDIAKAEILMVFRDSTGQYTRPIKVRQPVEIALIVKQLAVLAKERPLSIAMESTGTYGDAFRQALTDAGLAVRIVSAVATKNYAETFDGVASNHDGKDAAIVAELNAIGKSKPWPWKESTIWEQEVNRMVNWLDIQQDILQLWLGRLKALLARHWPEVLRLLKLRSETLLRILVKFGSPAALAQEPEAREYLCRWGGRLLQESKVTAVLESAQATVGVRMDAETIQMVQRYAKEAQTARREVNRAKRALKALGQENELVVRMEEAVGIVTACVLWSSVGDPRKYHCGHAYLKALGLNLKERSSGKHQGKLKITKRGPSQARRWLYFSAMRAAQQTPIKPWFEKKKRKDKGHARGALIGIMRKLVLAVHAVCVHSEAFSWRRLFPRRPWPRLNDQRNAAGALPPDPRNLSPTGQSRKGKEGVTKGSSTPNLSTSATGAALGSVSTGALSSAQSKKDLARR